MNIDYYILTQLLNFDINADRISCVDTDYRTILPILISKGIVIVNDKCTDIKIDVGNIINPMTASFSLQWLGVNPFKRIEAHDAVLEKLVYKMFNIISVDDNYNEIIKRRVFHDLKLVYNNNKELGDNIFHSLKKTNIQNFDITHVNIVLNVIINNIDSIISAFGNDKKFLKLSAITSRGNFLTLSSHKIIVENKNYSKLLPLLYNFNTPHISAYFASKLCSVKESKKINSQLIDINGQTDTVLSYFKTNNIFNDALDSYMLLSTELLENSFSFQYVVKNIGTGIDANSIACLMFQMIYTLNIFSQINFVHSDLHIGNVYVEKCKKHFTNYYVLTDASGSISNVVRLDSNLILKIIDFDMSFFIDSDDENNNNLKQQHPNNFISEHPILLHKFDLYYFFKWYESFHSFDPNYKKYKYIIYLIKYILYGKYANDIGFGNNICSSNVNVYKLPSKLVETEIVLSITPPEAMSLFLSLDAQFLADSGILVYQDLASIPLDSSSRIYIYKNADINDLIEQIQTNPDWNNLTPAQQANVCFPFVDSGQCIKSISDTMLSILINSLHNVNDIIGGSNGGKYIV